MYDVKGSSLAQSLGVWGGFGVAETNFRLARVQARDKPRVKKLTHQRTAKAHGGFAKQGVARV